MYWPQGIGITIEIMVIHFQVKGHIHKDSRFTSIMRQNLLYLTQKNELIGLDMFEFVMKGSVRQSALMICICYQ